MEGKKPRLPPDILDLVFSWSLDDIFNDELYADKVERIPQTFQSVDHYLQCFVYPLIEETRQELCSGIEAIADAPFSDIVAIKEAKRSGERFYDVTVQTWTRESAAGSKEVYKPVLDDVLLLTDVRPETPSDLGRHGRTFALASITSVEDDGESQTEFRVRASKRMEIFDVAVFLLNMTTSSRIWKALGIGSCVSGNLDIIRGVLCPDPVAGEVCDLCCHEDISSDWARRLSELNESQTEAVLASIREMQCEHKTSVKLIWGPPGTGKTKTLSELLWLLLVMKCDVISCAPTNTAVLEVASRLLRLVKRENREEAGEGHLPCPLGDVVLFGNKINLNIVDHSDLCDIFLDKRVDRLVECFDPLSGWQHHVRSMIELLDDSVSRYQIYTENEKHKHSEENGGQVVEYHVRHHATTFLQFLKDRFAAVAAPLGSMTQDLCTHLPHTFVSRENYDNMVSLLASIEEFEALISRHDLVNIGLEDIFRNAGDVRDMTFVDMNEEERKKASLPILLSRSSCRCLHILESLRDFFSLPTFFDKTRIRDLCLHSASIVICTSSSSFKLLGKRSFKLLIIDEASQVKECESVIPLQLSGIRHAVLFGDERQLPAVVKSMVSAEAGFGRSLFERLSSIGHPKHLLRIQYRMHPSNSSFPNEKFYAGQVLDAPSVSCISYEKCYIPGRMYGPYSFINVADSREDYDDFAHSWKNMVEAAVVLKIVQNISKAANTAKFNPSIGILSPYAAQVASIKERLGSHLGAYSPLQVNVWSIDGFQGGEDDIIIISTVRSNGNGKIGLLSSHWANIALTRARHCLWIIGNAFTLIRSCSIWRDLIKDAEKRGCLFNADEDKQLSKAMFDVKKELDQIDDLLHPDSLLFRTARWKVLFSGTFKKSFAKIPSSQKKKLVIALLLKLAGGWRPKKRIDNVVEDFRHLVKLYKVEELHVVCTIDIMKYLEHMQVLKIWDILPLTDVPILVKRLVAIFDLYTDEYISRCQMTNFEGKLEIPISWENDINIVQYRSLQREMTTKEQDCGQSDGRSYAENSKISESLILMKFYSLSSGVVNHMISNYDGKELDLPFEVTDQEREIVIFRKSSFILGRSGTGKTTVLTTKLIQKQQQHHLSLTGLSDLEDYSSPVVHREKRTKEDSICVNENVLHQLFVTVSSKLCSVIKNHICRLNRLVSGGDYFADDNSDDMYDISDSFMDFADISDSFADIPSKKYPLVITFHKFLMILDGSLATSFFRRFRALDKLPVNEKGYSCSPAFCAFIRRKEVNYDRFISGYWPHFNTQLTKKLDPSVVYKEIMSHIKGGWAVSEANDDILVREEYIRLSERRASTVDSDIRELIFDIFLAYEKMKLRNGDFDLADLVIYIHRQLKVAGGYLGDKMDFVYVDEVQDLTMQQVALFKYVCSNFDEGFVFAGDTAQTIAQGIDFTFQDIRSLFYTEYLSVVDTDKVRDKDKHMSDLFHLTQNFRTHAGILRLAQSVMELLYCFFPQSVDRLPPETSLINGEAPVVLESVNDEDVISMIFGRYAGTGSSNISNGFGAEQVVLVRDEACKKEISSQLGKQALVLTIIECKGLEFQDVLLYNFFGASPLRNQWRVIYGYMQSQNLLHPSFTGGFPCFEITKHNVLCSELKQLYVAITRTRQRLWILESNTEFSWPMLEYWKSLCLVQSRKIDDSLAQAMRVVSSKEEWRARGVKLYKEGKYEMAAMCFERAEDTYRGKWARASGLRASANHMLHLNHGMARADLTKAAEMYETIGKPEQAATCYIDLGQYKKAGTIYLEKCGHSRCEDAGDCFVLGRCWSLASEAYAEGNKFNKCLSACSKGKLFEKGWTFILDWKENATLDSLVARGHKLNEISDQFLIESVLHYHKVKDKHNMLKFFRALNDMEHAGNCFYEKSCWSLAAKAYVKAKKLSECLSACVEGLLVEMGLNFIEHWKENATLDDVTASSQNLVEMKDSFLERCIIHYHEIKNKDSMLKFVRAFSSVEYARTFLRSHDYLDELFMVEKESGNLLQAANVAKLKGDLVLEANMLAKAGNYEEASRLILFHVVVNSLWTSRRRGWPPMQFREKDELLRRAEMLSQKGSREFQESVCVQSGILSDQKGILLDLVKSMNSSLENRNVRADIFSVRKLLDFHLHSKPYNFFWETEISSTLENYSNTMLLSNVISSETLVFMWNLWKENIWNILRYLHLDNTRDGDYSSYVDFCLEYFGLRNVGDERYIVIIADASWIQDFDVRPLCRISGRTYIQESQFLSVAKCYWASELAAVGWKVLMMLKSLDNFCLRENLLFCQGTIVLHIYEVSKFLIESELLSSKLNKRPLQNFLELSKRRFFEIVFPLDWKQTATLNMFSLRQQDLAVELLRKILAVNVSVGNHKLSFGQISRIVMLIFTSGMPGEELYLIIHKQFGVAHPPWGTFLEKLGQNKGSEQQVLLTMAFQDALQSTFHVDWQSEVDYVSPHCFMYLAERLLYMASGCQQVFYTTKSSLMEAISSPLCETTFGDFLGRHSYLQRNLTDCYDFLAHMVQSILSDESATAEWIGRSKIHANRYIPLRLMIMVGLVHLNSGCHFDSLLKILQLTDVAQKLPQVFYDCFKNVSIHNFAEMFARALKAIEDPLVMVSFNVKCQNFPPAHSIFVDIGALKSRKDILEVLVPQKNANWKSEPLCNGVDNPCVADLPSSGSFEGSDSHSSDPSARAEESKVIERGDCISYEIYASSWAVLDLFTSQEYLKHRDAGTFASDVLEIQKLRESIWLLLTSFKHLNQDELQKDGKGFFEETSLMLEELKQLSKLLSEEELELKMPLIEDLSARLRKRRPRLMESLYQSITNMVAKFPAETSASVPSTHGQGDKGKPNNLPKER